VNNARRVIASEAIAKHPVGKQPPRSNVEIASQKPLAMTLGALILLATIIRVWNLDAHSLWFDELLSISISRLPLSSVVTSPASIDPPLYYVLLHFWLNISRDDAFIRLLSALPGIATVPALYLLARDLFDTRVGLVAAAILALSPLQIFYAQEARMYSLLVLFSILSTWTYLRAQKTNRARDWVLWIIATLAALYTHNFAGLLLLALDLDALARWQRDRASLSRVVVANVVIGVAFLPWFIVLLPKFSWLAPALWLQPPTILHPLLTLYAFTFGYTLPLPLSALALFLLLAALAFLCIALWRQGVNASLRLLVLTLLLPILITLLVSQWRSVYLDRLLLESSPALSILLAWGIVASNRRAVLRVCAMLAAPLILIALFNYFTVADYAKPPLRDIVAHVAAQRTMNELVIHTSDSSFLAARHYDPRGNHLLLHHPADQWLTPALMNDLRVPYATDAAMMIANENQFWLVVALDHIAEEQLAEKSIFDALASLQAQSFIGGIGVYHYERK
jgi:uncharacterized membrane protein